MYKVGIAIGWRGKIFPTLSYTMNDTHTHLNLQQFFAKKYILPRIEKRRLNQTNQDEIRWRWNSYVHLKICLISYERNGGKEQSEKHNIIQSEFDYSSPLKKFQRFLLFSTEITMQQFCSISNIQLERIIFFDCYFGEIMYKL